MKIGFLGGSFDPVHFGHLIAAQDVYEKYHFDRLFLVTSADGPETVAEPVEPLEVAARMAASLRFERAPLLALYEKFRFAFPDVRNEHLEAEIEISETQLRELEERLASPDLYREGEKVKETTQAFEEAKIRLAQLYEHWEEAVELN